MIPKNLAAPGVLADLVHSSTASVVTVNFPAHRRVCHDGKKAARSKSIGREEQSWHIAQAGAKESLDPQKQTSANPLSPSQNPQESAAGFPIRAALTP